MLKYAIIVAGGIGERMGSEIPKQFLVIGKFPLLMYSIKAFYDFEKKVKIVVALPEKEITTWEKLRIEYSFNLKHKVVAGGDTRFYSVKNALEQIKKDGLVAIHDGVRPLVSQSTIAKCYETAKTKGNAVVYMNINETVRLVDNAGNRPVDRSKYKRMQTPQIYSTEVLKKAYQQDYCPEFTDDANVVEKTGEIINLIEGNKENIKITDKTDLIIAEALLKNMHK